MEQCCVPPCEGGCPACYYANKENRCTDVHCACNKPDSLYRCRGLQDKRYSSASTSSLPPPNA